MIDQINAQAGCLLVGEYVDEVELPTDAQTHPGEVVRPRLAADHVDVWSSREEAADSLSRALLQVVKAETHGPSRARMVESIVRLQALATLREVLRQPCPKGSGLHKYTVQAVAELFGSSEEGLHELLLSLSEARKED